MDETTRRAIQLLEEAQTGGAARVLPAAEAALREGTGELVDGPAALHFARIVSLVCLGDLRGAIAAVDAMLVAADREGSAGWRSCALSLRAIERLHLGEQDAAEYDIEAALRDLAGAEAALLAGEPEPVVAGNAHTEIGIGYHALRLYELATPQFEAAYEASCRSSYANGNPAMWLCNLAIAHLEWALELYQIGEETDAQKHTAEAEQYAMRAAAEASGPKAEVWRLTALLFAASARADRCDPAPAADEIRELTDLLTSRGVLDRRLSVITEPFRVVAESRAGRHDAAMALIDEALATVTADEWLICAALHRTRATILAALGQRDALAALGYGDTLGKALWRQRQQTLHVAGAVRSYELLRVQHEQATRAALTDPLTGVANRRGLDQFVDGMADDPHAARQCIAALIVDIDGFKSINDSFGHDAGDEVLIAVAQAVSGCIREGDVVARVGGDEFAVLLPGADLATAIRVANRIVVAVDALPGCGVTVSVGVASGRGSSVRETFAQADRAMYGAKRAGGNAYVSTDSTVTSP